MRFSKEICFVYNLFYFVWMHLIDMIFGFLIGVFCKCNLLFSFYNDLLFYFYLSRVARFMRQGKFIK